MVRRLSVYVDWWIAPELEQMPAETFLPAGTDPYARIEERLLETGRAFLAARPILGELNLVGLLLPKGDYGLQVIATLPTGHGCDHGE